MLVLSDSIGALSLGFADAFDPIHAQMTGAPSGSWATPNQWATGDLEDGFLRWDTTGAVTNAEIGVDGTGVIMAAGSSMTSIEEHAGERIAVYYEARPDGGPVAWTILDRDDAVASGTFDTRQDERGETVSSPTKSQRAVLAADLAADRTYGLRLEVETGSAAIEAAHWMPSAGVELHGHGYSGQSTGEMNTAGNAAAYLEAMAARGEPPDLVVLASDTGDGDLPTAAAMRAALEETLRWVRASAPDAAIAYYLPPQHNTNRDAWVADYVPTLRELASDEDLLLIDGYAAAGDISEAGGDPDDLATEDDHFTAEGQDRINTAFLDVLHEVVPTR